MMTDAEELPVGQLLEIDGKFHIVIDGQPDIVCSQQPQLSFSQIQMNEKGIIQVGSYVYILDGQIVAMKEGALVYGYYYENYRDGKVVIEQDEDDVLRVASDFDDSYEEAKIFRDPRGFDGFEFFEENEGSSSGPRGKGKAKTSDEDGEYSPFYGYSGPFTASEGLYPDLTEGSSSSTVNNFVVPNNLPADHRRDLTFAAKAQELLGLLSAIDIEQLDYVGIVATKQTRPSNLMDFNRVLFERGLELLQQRNNSVRNTNNDVDVMSEYSINGEDSPEEETPRERTRHKLRRLKEEGTPISWEAKANQLALSENEIANLKKVKVFFEKLKQFFELIAKCQKGPVGADDLLPLLQKQFQKILVTDDHIAKTEAIYTQLQDKGLSGIETYLAVTFYGVLSTLENVNTKRYLQIAEENLMNEFAAQFTVFKEELDEKTRENTRCKDLLQNLSYLCANVSTLDELEQSFSLQITSNLPTTFKGESPNQADRFADTLKQQFNGFLGKFNLKPSNKQNINPNEEIYSTLVFKLIDFKEELFSTLKEKRINHNLELAASIVHAAQSSSVLGGGSV